MLVAAVTPHSYAMFRVLLGEVGRMPQMAELVIRSNDMFAVGIERVVMVAQEGGQFRQYSAAAVATTAIGLMSSNPANRAMPRDPQFLDRLAKGRRVGKQWGSTRRFRGMAYD